MSWNVTIVIDTGGPEKAVVEEVRNVTYNNAGLLTYLGVHPGSKPVEDPVCAKWIGPLNQALSKFYDDKAIKEMQMFEPTNGWGGRDDVMDLIEKLLTACKRHPKAEVKWS